MLLVASTADSDKINKELVMNMGSRLVTKEKTGFTLAEVLITLGIIGVVAALTIPTLIVDYQQHETVTKLQRAISVINQAYKLSFDDVGEPSSAFEIGNEEYFKTYWQPYIKVLTYCTSYSFCGYENNSPFTNVLGKNISVAVSDLKSRTSFLTMDGFLYIIYVGNYPTIDGKVVFSSFPRVLVDINGGRKPNREGKDVFWLERTEKNGGGVQPLGYDASNSVVNSYCSKTEGQFCAEKIRRAGWKINKDYPW